MRACVQGSPATDTLHTSWVSCSSVSTWSPNSTSTGCCMSRGLSTKERTVKTAPQGDDASAADTLGRITPTDAPDPICGALLSVSLSSLRCCLLTLAAHTSHRTRTGSKVRHTGGPPLALPPCSFQSPSQLVPVFFPQATTRFFLPLQHEIFAQIALLSVYSSRSHSML